MRQSWRTSISCTTSWGSQRRSSEVRRQPVREPEIWNGWRERSFPFNMQYAWSRNVEVRWISKKGFLFRNQSLLGSLSLSLCLPEYILEQKPPFPKILGLLIYSRSKLLTILLFCYFSTCRVRWWWKMPWWWDEGLVDDHSSQIGDLIGDDMRWLIHLRLEGHIARLQRHTEELRNSLEGAQRTREVHQGGLNMDWHAAHVVYSVNKFPAFCFHILQELTKAVDNTCDMWFCPVWLFMVQDATFRGGA